MRYRLGDEFLDYAINPFVAGVYAGDPEQLSAPAAFPKLYALEQKYGSFIKGAVRGARERRKRKEVARDRARMFSFRDGMDTFPRALEKSLRSTVRFDSSVDRISPGQGEQILTVTTGGKTGNESFERVIFAVPADALATIVGKLSPQKAGLFATIQYPPVAVVFTGFRNADVKRDLDGFGYLIPEAEQRQTLGSLWNSSIFPGRAPEGCCALTTFVGGTRQPHNASLADDQLLKLVVDELGDIIGLGGDPVLTCIRRWSRAIPQYAMGYGTIQKSFTELEREFPGLYFAGNVRNGISVGDSVLCAFNTVQKILKQD